MKDNENEQRFSYFEMKELLEGVNIQQDQNMREKYDRSLPFQDGLFDRWERARRLGFGEGSNIYNSAFVFGKVTVGCNVWIGPYALLDGGGGELKIGDNSAIGPAVQIYTHDTVLRTLSAGKHPLNLAPVTIGDCCHIGPQTTIIAGVVLGNRCLVGINSFVNKSFGDNAIIVGCPARQVGRVEVLDNGSVELVYGSEDRKQRADDR